MAQIFISYSKHNRDFALRLTEDLSRFFEVWIDREGIEGGLEWEQAIEEGIQTCKVFLVIVSPQSNESEWVARETIRAEQLEKYRIPVLLDGELPLRLLNLHYIDFQGAYEGGLRDLLEAIEKEITPLDRTQEEVTRLIGQGIRAFLGQDYPTASSFIGQALVLDNTLASSTDEFWEKLRIEQTSDLAKYYENQIEIRERAEFIETQKSKRGEYHIWRWSVEVAAPDDLLDQIDYVKYKLHETFSNPIQIVRARESNFMYQANGWGTFPVFVWVYFKDGTWIYGNYELAFENRQLPLD